MTFSVRPRTRSVWSSWSRVRRASTCRGRVVGAALRRRGDPRVRAQPPGSPARHLPRGLAPRRPGTDTRSRSSRCASTSALRQHRTITDGMPPPSVKPLASQLQHFARHRHGDPRDGPLVDERVDHFGTPPSSRFACDKYAAARRSTSFSCSRSRLRRRSSRFPGRLVPGV